MEELSSCFLKGAHTNWSVLAEDYNSIACTLSEGGVLDILHWRQERWILLRQLASHSQVNYGLMRIGDPPSKRSKLLSNCIVQSLWILHIQYLSSSQTSPDAVLRKGPHLSNELHCGSKQTPFDIWEPYGSAAPIIQRCQQVPDL